MKTLTKEEIINQIKEEIETFHINFPNATGFNTKYEEKHLRTVLWNCYAQAKKAMNYTKKDLMEAWRHIEEQNMACI